MVISNPREGEFLQRIDWNKEEITEAVAAITRQYEGLVYTEEQMAAAKKDRASLNALKKAISDRRIQVKKTLMAPYDEFEREVKEVTDLIDKPIAMIDEQTSAYENRLKDEKKAEIEKFFAENAHVEGVTLDMIFNPKWLNKTTSMAACKEEILGTLERIDKELATIEDSVEERYREYARDIYITNGRDISMALERIRRMRDLDKHKEEKARAAAEQASQAASETERCVPATEMAEEAASRDELRDPAATQTQEAAEPPAENGADTKVYRSSFTVTGTMAQIAAVRDFMDRNGIKYGKAGE